MSATLLHGTVLASLAWTLLHGTGGDGRALSEIVMMREELNSLNPTNLPQKVSNIMVIL